MAGGRQPKFTVVVGKREFGKTYTSMKILRQYVAGNPAMGIKGRRVLILDVNDEFTEVKSINLKDVAWFSFHPTIEMRRVRPYKENGKRMGLDELSAALSFILDNFKFGLLLVEDVNKYVSDTIGKDLYGGIVTLRHVDCDVIMHMQTKGKAGNPKILGNCNIMRMHKTGDTVDRHRDKYIDFYDIVKIGETIVNYRVRGTAETPPDKYFFLYCDFDKEKIIGEFTKREAERAVRELIWENEATMIKPMLRQRDENGNLVYKDEQEAMQDKLYELMDLYFKFN